MTILARTSYIILANCLSTHLGLLKRKTYNTRVVRNGEVNLFLKGNFKLFNVWDKVDKNFSKLET
jgi:hypothetical protein